MTLLKGAARLNAAHDAQTRYYAGDSLRAIARSMRRSYGYVHKLLAQVDTEMRPRGGGHRRAHS